MNILLIDNDSFFLKELKEDLLLFFSNYNSRTKFACISQNFFNVNFEKFQMIFLDIDLSIDNSNGIQLAKYIRSTNPTCYIIFVSVKNNLVHSSLVVQPFFFIRKIFYKQDLNIFFNLVKSKIELSDILNLEYQTNHYTIYPEDIIFIEASQHAVHIQTVHGDYYDHHTLKSFFKLLPENYFVQIHRSVIINLKFLICYSNNKVYLTSNYEFNIGRIYKANFFNKEEKNIIL